MDQNRQRPDTYIAASAIAAAILLLGLYVAFFTIHGQRIDYYLDLYGGDLTVHPRIFARVTSSDGIFARDAEMVIDGKKVDGWLLDARQNIHAIKVTVGGVSAEYAIDWAKLYERSRGGFGEVFPNEKDIENASNAVKMISVGGRELFVMPRDFRFYPEFSNQLHVFCFTWEGACSDISVLLSGKEVPLDRGYGMVDLVPPVDGRLQVLFDDGSSGVIIAPFNGKYFFIRETAGSLTVHTVSDARNVHVDCYRSGLWQFTDVIDVTYEGVRLPENYKDCGRIQLSFDSANPGGSMFVLTREAASPAQVHDPYGAALLERMKRFMPERLGIINAAYDASRFITLKSLFSGADYAKQFTLQRKSREKIVWWAMVVVSVFELYLFGLYLWRRIEVIEGEEGELISRSLRQQKLLIAVAVGGVALFFILMLAVMRNLA